MTLSVQRKSLIPEPGDNWQIIAERELTELDVDNAISQLQSWNFHVCMRPAGTPGSEHEHNPILPSDVIFLEPPLAG